MNFNVSILRQRTLRSGRALGLHPEGLPGIRGYSPRALGTVCVSPASICALVLVCAQARIGACARAHAPAPTPGFRCAHIPERSQLLAHPVQFSAH